ncbi:hypothetical protein ACT80S_14135 [Ramlibacter sp. MAHUQ-53]|uniref:hypothetical protein n=1 Tax=unclassified Ramlibacter TaxID=2617605 RepID=UPI0036303858
MNKQLTLAAATLAATTAAFAHEGHGIAGASHWHATDTLGLLLAVGFAGLAWWFTRGGK